MVEKSAECDEPKASKDVRYDSIVVWTELRDFVDKRRVEGTLFRNRLYYCFITRVVRDLALSCGGFPADWCRLYIAITLKPTTPIARSRRKSLGLSGRRLPVLPDKPAR